jgi:nickel/cobalt transporter (NicO) family protein
VNPALALAAALAVPAHPLGNFTVNRYDGVVVAAHEVRVDHVQDLAEIPAAQVLQGGDLDRWATRECASASAGFRVTVDGRPVRMTVRTATARRSPGQAGLPTLRLECAMTAPLSLRAGGTAVAFHDEGATGRVGWREVTAAGDGTTLRSADVPAASASARLTSYPKDLLSSPLDRRSASLTVTPGGPPLSASPGASVSRVLPRGVDRLTQAFTGLIGRRALSPGFALLALATAVVLGAAHALAPGHGKTIMAAQALSRGRRSLRDVVALGLTVTVTHTAGVLALALLVASGSALAGPATFGWLGATSGVLVAVAGVTLLRRALASAGHSHDHGHSHGHGHDHGHGHHHHDHDAMPRRGTVLLMGFVGGMLPSPSAVVVLLGATAVGHAWFGLLLVLAYGLGLALTLTSIGVFVTGAGRRLAARLPSLRERLPRLPRLPVRWVPAGSACLVVLLGLQLTARSLSSVLG